MTVFLPLGEGTATPPSPTFLCPAPEPTDYWKRVIKAILKAKHIAVVCGAGISVKAGIPDFRSSNGLFQSLKKDNPSLSSGRDLFDASVFKAEDTTALFYQMIAQLARMSESAEPTPFHQLLRVLDDRGKLLRVYTQNIDALELKSGLTFGVPDVGVPRGKPKSKAGPSASQDMPGRLPSPPPEIPRCIPLHGTLDTMHCVSCTHVFPLRDHLEHLNSGIPPGCPECTTLEKVRQMSGKRSRGVGKLRPSVVLYNEDHKDGEHVGEVVRKDLTGISPRADLLLVVGTSLRVPGTKRIVREFSKAVRLRATKANANTNNTGGECDPQTTSPRRTPVSNEGPITSMYLNLDFPVPTRDWEGVFDVWLKGDAQEFAKAIRAEFEKADAVKEAALERKRKREEAAATLAALGEIQTEPQLKKQKVSKKKLSKSSSLLAPTPTPTDSRLNLKSRTTPISANLTRIDRLPSPDEERESSQQKKFFLRIPASRSRSQKRASPVPPLPPHRLEVVLEQRPLLVYVDPSGHGQASVQPQANLKDVFPVTKGKPTAKLK
ncbi:DHS-like NAD/FAD-binding domain-containing protein [Thelephora terrestris]|uniref:DHS-like NAD/FAD-binding domain-containing protein n=1 Tax=Thelephora terrestris TaxID=56493 RepID=A0A9P6LBB2_9AGAM|nr:DHS-like NAD/FAD-binding domain-containing protein [Thelephora terrestris]